MLPERRFTTDGAEIGQPIFWVAHYGPSASVGHLGRKRTEWTALGNHVSAQNKLAELDAFLTAGLAPF